MVRCVVWTVRRKHFAFIMASKNLISCFVATQFDETWLCLMLVMHLAAGWPRRIALKCGGKCFFSNLFFSKLREKPKYIAADVFFYLNMLFCCLQDAGKPCKLQACLKHRPTCAGECWSRPLWFHGMVSIFNFDSKICSNCRKKAKIRTHIAPNMYMYAYVSHLVYSVFLLCALLPYAADSNHQSLFLGWSWVMFCVRLLIIKWSQHQFWLDLQTLICVPIFPFIGFTQVCFFFSFTDSGAHG